MSARGFLHRHSLGLAVLGVFLAFSAGAMVSGYFQYHLLAEMHGGRFGWSSYTLWQGYNYTLTLVSGSFNALLLIVATKWLREVGSAESRDPEHERG